MAENEAKKKKNTFGKICSIVVDVLVIPVIILAFVCTIFTFSAKANNKVPQIFGKSIVTVLSGSMEPEYKQGDVLVISQVSNLDTLKIGDNIAFYAPVWLGWPFTTKLDNGEKVSNVIYHKIVDIIYVDTDNDKNTPGVRHFVCRGTNLSDPEYTYVGEGNGNYKKEVDGETEKFVISQGTGDYDIVLENMPPQTNEDSITQDNIQDSSMDTMQYITDEFVVGIYDSSLSPAIAGFIKFSSSSTGLLCMVIIPAALMLAFVVVGLVKEIKENKEEEAEDKLVLEGNISKLKETSLQIKEEVAKKEYAKQEAQVQPEKEEEVDIASVIGGVVGTFNGIKQPKPKAKIDAKTVKLEDKAESSTEKVEINKKQQINVKPVETNGKKAALKVEKTEGKAQAKTMPAKVEVAKTPVKTPKPVAKGTASTKETSKPVVNTKATTAKTIAKPSATKKEIIAPKPAVKKAPTKKAE